MDREADLTSWIPLAGCAGLSPALIGRKAAILAALAADGVPTPGGHVLPAAAFWEALEQCGVAERARYLATAALRLDPDHALAIAATIAGDLAAAPLEAIAAPFAAAAFARAPALRLVCRSSAVMEDGRVAAFPGMFLSVLDIGSADALAAAIAACWRSVFQPALLRYLLRMRPAGIDFSLALIVQPQVDAAWYGVCFSENPLAPGAGMVAQLSDVSPDALVGGAPPRLRFAWRDGAWRGESAAPAGLDRVGRLAARLDRRQGMPVDIEFALPRSGGEPILLQCRPITARAAPAAPPYSGLVIERFGGTPTAPGRIVGRAQAGDVALVRQVTTQDYTVILASRALVASAQTSPLSHAAILCRELGVPLVSGIGAGIDRLRGRWLLVDGDEGDVLVVAGADAADRSAVPSPDEKDAVLTATELLFRLCARAACGDDPDAVLQDVLADYRRGLGAPRHRIIADAELPADSADLLASAFGPRLAAGASATFLERAIAGGRSSGSARARLP